MFPHASLHLVTALGTGLVQPRADLAVHAVVYRAVHGERSVQGNPLALEEELVLKSLKSP